MLLNCGVGVLCIGATGGRVGGTGVRVWRAPAGAGVTKRLSTVYATLKYTALV